jgi:hypothetical protein
MHNHRTTAHVAHRIDHERQASQMIQVRMSDEDVIDLRELGDRQITNACSSVNQDVVVDQKRGGAQMSPTDAAAAT